MSNDKNQESMAADSRTISKISMEHVDFGYGEKKVLQDICFQMKKGEKIALVGESGFGGLSSSFDEGRMGGMSEAFHGAVCRKSAVCGVFGGECGAFRKRR